MEIYFSHIFLKYRIMRVTAGCVVCDRWRLKQWQRSSGPGSTVSHRSLREYCCEEFVFQPDY